MGWKSSRQAKALCNAWIKQANAAGGTDEAAFDAVVNKFSNKISISRMPLKYLRLPHEPQEHAVITIGISQDEGKMRIKYGEGFR